MPEKEIDAQSQEVASPVAKDVESEAVIDSELSESEFCSRVRTRAGKAVLSRLKLKAETVKAFASCLAVRADEGTLDMLISISMKALGVKSHD